MRKNKHILITSLLLSALLFFVPSAAFSQPPLGLHQMIYAVYINGKKLNQTVYALEGVNGSVYIPLQMLDEWKLKHTRAYVIDYESITYVNLAELPNLSYKVNPGSLTLYINASAQAFVSNQIEISDDERPLAVKPSFGSFLNYDLSAMRDDQGEHKNQFGGLGELGIFNQYGVGIGDFLAQSNRDGEKFVRLDTTWTMDQPQNMASIRLGDAITTAGSWSGAVRFGGIQYATNFGTQPGFITNPLPTVAGEATIPSVADFIVDNATISRQHLNPGPYVVSGLPVVTGGGDVVVVTQDLLGRESVYQVPYYTSQKLLKSGLNQYSYSVGFARDNFGIDSNDYGRFVSTGDFRHGFTNHLTGEAHAEVLSNQQDLGFSTNYQLGYFGVLTTGVAGSHSKLGTGGLLLMGFERRTNHLSFNTRVELTSNDFTRLGLQPGERAPSVNAQSFVGYSAKDLGSFGVGYIVQQNRGDKSDAELVTGSYTRNITSHISVLLAGMVDTHESRQSRVYAEINFHLGNNRTATVSSNLQRDLNQFGAQLYKQLPDGPGYGYQFGGNTGSVNSYNAELAYQNTIGTYSAQVNGFDGDNNYQANVSGGIVYMNRDFFLSRRVDESFAVAEVPGFPGVDIYEDGHYMGKTNRRGNVLIPGLLAYQNNPIHFNPKDLPLNTQIKSNEINAVPYFRSGVLVRFHVKPILSALMTIQQEDGQFVPQGARMIINNNPEAFLVANEGEAYATGLQYRNRAIVYWDNHHCSFNFIYLPNNNPLPNLGTMICQGGNNAT